MKLISFDNFRFAYRAARRYVVKMVPVFRDGIGKVIKYVSTPLHGLLCVILALIGAAWWGPFTLVERYIVLGMVALVIVVLLGLLVFKPRHLQFTGEEIITWQRERLGDSASKVEYLQGELKALDVFEHKPIEDKATDSRSNPE